MLDWFIQFKDIIIYGLLVFLSLIQVLLVIFKKPFKLTDSLKEMIIEKLPSAISIAEGSNFKGSDKLHYCWLIVRDWLIEIVQCSNPDYYEKFVKDNIEKILSTPQKKGGN